MSVWDTDWLRRDRREEESPVDSAREEETQLPAVIAAAIRAIELPAPQVHVEAPEPPVVDTDPFAAALREVAAAQIDEKQLASLIAQQVAQAMDPQVAAMNAVIDELAALRKKFNSAARGGGGGGGGGATEVSLRSGADRMPVAADNPLPVSTVGLVAGVDYDEIETSYPNATTEVYAYSLGGDPVQTVTVTYTNATKEVLDGVVWS